MSKLIVLGRVSHETKGPKVDVLAHDPSFTITGTCLDAGKEGLTVYSAGPQTAEKCVNIQR